MSKTIVLHSTDSSVARHLKQHGYEILDLHHPMGRQTDAVLFAGYRPDSIMFTHSDCADITIGSCHLSHPDQPLRLNITGQTPEQVLSMLEAHIGRRE